MSPFIVEGSSSKIAHSIVAVLHLCAIVFIIFSFDFQYIIIVMPLLISWLCAHYQYSEKRKNFIRKIEVRPDMQAVIFFNNSEQGVPVRVGQGSFVSRWALMIVWQFLDEPKTVRQTLWRDSITNHAYHHLQVYLNIHQGKV